MLNKRNRNKSYKTHIDITNYNKFLYELDKKSIIKTSNKINSMKTILDNIDQTFKKCNYSDSFFTGINSDFEKVNICSPSINKSKTKVFIDFEINNISDILELIEKYPLDEHIEYNINMDILHKIKEPLIQLNNMIGLHHIKENIIDQILFYIQKLHNSNIDFMHTVIYGPPGTGKTEVAKIIGSIFSKIGILKKGVFKKVTRSDLVAGYLGQTALKTRDVIKECLGGVLFIDEAYSLGNNDKIDSFSKECVDTLCEALSDHKDNLMVIIAGYENELNDSFFTINQGLNSRFTWRFKIDEYNAEDLYKIFIKKVNDCGWTVNNSDINIKWFETAKPQLKYYGRDIETLLSKVKIAHSKRVFCKDITEKKIITINDLNKGFKMYLNNQNINDESNYKKLIFTMYT
jgi:replication-associated recombination protein RarA